MKTSRIFLAVLAMATGLTLRAAAEKPANNPRVQVVFFEPEKFTDVRSTYMATDSDREAILSEIRDFVSQRANAYVADGQKLEVTFTDIDMAGDFEPWRGARFGDVRIVKDIYPPRINLTYRLTDADGNVIKQAKRELRDPAFNMHLTLASKDDPLRYEKELLDNWLRSDFERVKK